MLLAFLILGTDDIVHIDFIHGFFYSLELSSQKLTSRPSASRNSPKIEQK